MCRPLLTTLLTLLIIGTASLGVAQQPGDTVVVVVKEAKIKVGTEVIGTSQIGHSLRVRQVQEPWLWVASDGRTGWIRSRDVVPLNRAVTHFSQQLRERPRDADAYFGRGVARLMLRETDAAIADFSEAIRLDSNYAWAFAKRGIAWNNKDEWEKAIADLNEAIRLDPTLDVAHFARGLSRWQRGDHDLAISDYTTVIDRDPKSALAFYGRGANWQEVGKIDKAIADFNEAIRLAPKDPFAPNDRGKAWAEKGDLDKAIADFTKAISLAQDFYDPYYNRGNAWGEKGNPRKAIDDFTEAIRLKPDFEFAYENRGAAHRDLGEYKQAFEDFNQAVRLNPYCAMALASRGSEWGRQGKYEEAIADFTEAVRLDPEFADAYNNRGNAWSSKGDYAKAKSDWGEAIRINPDLFAAYSNRAWLLATCPSDELRDGNQAMQDAKTACELTDWKDARALSSLAAAYAEVGDFERAIEYESKAIEATSSGKVLDARKRLMLYAAQRPYRETPSDQPEPTRSQEETGPQIVAFFTRGDFSEVLVRPQYPPEQVVIVEPKGEFAEIDVAKTNAIMRKLMASDRYGALRTVKEITSNHGRYTPPAHYLAASAMFKLGDKDEATFWLFVAQLRARSDAMKVKHPMAGQAVAALNEMLGEPILEYAFKDWQKLKETVKRVVKWDRQQEREYDPRWIALHGMSAYSQTKIPFDSEQRWAEINEECRSAWLKDFRETIWSMEEADRDGDGQLDDTEQAAYWQGVMRQRVLEAYEKTKDSVTYEGRALEGVDVATFQTLDDPIFAKDQSHVYVSGYPIEGADAATFVVIKGPYSKDKSNLYCGTVKMDVADVNAFEVVHWDGMWRTATSKQFMLIDFGKALEKLELSEDKPAFIGQVWARDGTAYYFGPSRVQGADYDSFEVVDSFSAKDKNRTYMGALPAENFTARQPERLGID